MDPDTLNLVLGLLAFEAVQLVVVWIYIRQRYRGPLRQLNRLTGQLAAGERPATYYIAGARQVEEATRNLEAVGARLEQFRRQQGAEDFNLGVLLANMVEGVMVVDRGHVIRLANAELVRLFGLKQSPIERTVLEALREARVELILRQAMAGGGALQQEVTLEGGGRAENVRHFEVSVVPIRDRQGEVDGAVVVFHDITRIKQLEVVRREFVANVSHELRTPLAIFRGYLETLLDHPDLPREERRPMLEAMARNSERLHTLVEDLLTLTHIESARALPEYTLVRVGRLLQQIVADWNARTGSEPARIECEVPDDLPSLEVDAVRFEQVILNLLENAVAYSNPPRHIVLSAQADGAFLELRVADHGIGIPPDDLPHVFERFYRVDKGRSRTSGGTGLGLSITKHIVESHGGTIHAESKLGQGTTVIVRVPLAQK